MATESGTHELGLFRGPPRRRRPRDARGRFVRIEYSEQRLEVLAVARDMRERLGLPPSEWLEPYRSEKSKQKGSASDECS